MFVIKFDKFYFTKSVNSSFFKSLYKLMKFIKALYYSCYNRVVIRKGSI